MKSVVIPVTLLLLFVHSSTAIYAQEAKGKKSEHPLITAAEDTVGDVLNGENKEKDNSKPEQSGKDDELSPSPTDSPSPTITPDPVSPTPTPNVVIELPQVTLPIIGGLGGNNHENKKDEKTKENKDREKKEDVTASPTPPIVQESVQTPKSIQVSQKMQIKNSEDKDDDLPIAAVITKPIDPPLSLVRGAVKGSFYNTNGLSGKENLYAILASLGFVGIGIVLIKSDIAAYLMRKGRALPLPKSEPFTIPYIGTQYK